MTLNNTPDKQQAEGSEPDGIDKEQIIDTKPASSKLTPEQLKQWYADNKSLQQQVAELRAQLKDAQAAADRMQADIAKFQNTIDELKALVSKQGKEIKRYTDQSAMQVHTMVHSPDEHADAELAGLLCAGWQPINITVLARGRGLQRVVTLSRGSKQKQRQAPDSLQVWQPTGQPEQVIAEGNERVMQAFKAAAQNYLTSNFSSLEVH